MPHSAQPGNELGVFEEGNYYDQKDLDLFFSRYTNIPNGTHPVLNSINGAIGSVTNISEAGLEVLLDLELAYPLIYPQQIRLLEVLDQAQIENITYGQSSFDSFLDALDAVSLFNLRSLHPAPKANLLITHSHSARMREAIIKQ